jgi:hypothetical protein
MASCGPVELTDEGLSNLRSAFAHLLHCWDFLRLVEEEVGFEIQTSDLFVIAGECATPGEAHSLYKEELEEWLTRVRGDHLPADTEIVNIGDLIEDAAPCHFVEFAVSFKSQPPSDGELALHDVRLGVTHDRIDDEHDVFYFVPLEMELEFEERLEKYDEVVSFTNYRTKYGQ